MAWCTVTFNKQGGTGGTSTVYANYTNGLATYYASSQSTSSQYRISSITVPAKSGAIFSGYYTGTGGGGSNIASIGGALYLIPISGSSMTVYAYWRNGVKVTLDRNGGVGGTGTLYLKAGGGVYSDSAFTKPASSVSIPSDGIVKFLGYFTRGGRMFIDPGGNVMPEFESHIPTEDITITARWGTFGNVKDYFSLASAALVAESSDGGEDRRHVCAYNTTSETPATETGAVWMNPRVVYRVVGELDLDVTLGKGFACEVNNTNYGNKVTRTGYMMTSVEIRTSIGEAPTVTVTAVANEGYTGQVSSSGSFRHNPAATDAIRTYRVRAHISPRHRPQDVFSSLSLSGYNVQELTSVATCDPVVVAEDNVPCASDITHGRVEVSASVSDYGDGVSIAAGTGFTIVGEPVSNSGTGYKGVGVKARKELN